MMMPQLPGGATRPLGLTFDARAATTGILDTLVRALLLPPWPALNSALEEWVPLAAHSAA